LEWVLFFIVDYESCFLCLSLFSPLLVLFFLLSLYSYGPGLPGWPFLDQISEIWPHFKLVGQKNLNLLLAFVSPHLKLVCLKKYV